MTLGQNIKHYRKLAGLTQIELAEKTGEKQYSITKYERDLHAPNPEQIKKIAHALDTSIDLLFNERPKETKTTGFKKSSREGILIEAFEKLKPDQQRVILQQVEALGK